MVKKVKKGIFQASFSQGGSKKKIRIFTRSSDPANDISTRFFTKPDSDGRSVEVWDTGKGKKKGTRRYSIMGSGPAPRWLKEVFE